MTHDPRLDALPWAGDLLRDVKSAPPPVRVRIVSGEDAGQLGWTRYSRGGVWFWVELDTGECANYDVEEIEVAE